MAALRFRGREQTLSAAGFAAHLPVGGRAALITISSSRAQGGGDDESGRRLMDLAEQLGLEVAASELIADDRQLIESRLTHWADIEDCALILTSGGTGLTHDDLTPEATRAVIEREIPGIGEAMRLASRKHTIHWMLSRALAGVRGRTLIVNLPGSPRGVEQVGEALAEALPHALRLISGAPVRKQEHGGRQH